MFFFKCFEVVYLNGLSVVLGVMLMYVLVGVLFGEMVGLVVVGGVVCVSLFDVFNLL